MQCNYKRVNKLIFRFNNYPEVIQKDFLYFLKNKNGG